MTTWIDMSREAIKALNGDRPDQIERKSPAVLDARRRALQALRDTATDDDSRARFAAELEQLPPDDDPPPS